MSASYAVVVPHRIGASWIGAGRVGGRWIGTSWVGTSLVGSPADGGFDRPLRQTQQVYARRRLLAVLMLVSLVAVAWAGTSSVLASRGSVPASTPAVRPVAAATSLVAGANVDSEAAATYIVQPGDTLWSIAARMRGDRSLADYVAVLVDANGGASLAIGQQLVLP